MRKLIKVKNLDFANQESLIEELFDPLSGQDARSVLFQRHGQRVVIGPKLERVSRPELCLITFQFKETETARFRNWGIINSRDELVWYTRINLHHRRFVPSVTFRKCPNGRFVQSLGLSES